MTPIPFYLGCPVWACEHWQGELYRAKSPRRQWLSQYSQVFNTVEGNSTFYGLPSLDTVRRWAESTSPGFRFVLKFPRQITHDQKLHGATLPTRQFLTLLEVLANTDRLGPSMLQLPPYFSLDDLPRLHTFLAGLPREFPYAVEFRHLDFFDQHDGEEQANQLLREHGVDRVIFDSRPLYSAPASDDIELASQTRKPKLPVHKSLTGQRPIVRLIGRNRLDRIDSWLKHWVADLVGWLEGGVSPYLFAHTPDDRFAPEMAKRLHESLRAEWPSLPELPKWPGRSEAKQLRLF